MSPYFTQRPTRRQERISDQKWFLSKAFKFSLSLLVVIFGVLYVFQVSSASTKGFEMNDLRSRVRNLQKDNEKLELQIANYGSLSRIQERVSSMNFVAVSDVSYLTSAGTAVAMK